MQKIIIKNFGPIKDVELEIRDFMVFIGPQASGKSTIAKLVYFFKSFDVCVNDFFKQKTVNWTFDNFKTKIIPKRFLEFSEGKESNDTYIAYYFTDVYYVEIVGKTFSLNFSNQLETELQTLFHKLTPPKSDANVSKRQKLSEVKEEVVSEVRKLLTITQDCYFTPAERGELENKDIFSQDFQNLIEDIKYNSQMEKLANIKNVLLSFTKLQDLIKPIIKGKYVIEEEEEFIYSEQNGQQLKIPFQYSSSGQKSATRIISILLYFFVNKEEVSLIIEEPEAHLYPVGQQQLINVFVFFAGVTKSNIFITTHSPYLLTSLNNLVTAYKTAQMSEDAKEEVKKILPEEVWLNPEKLGVYYVNEGEIRSIIDENTGLIGVNELDDASDLIGDEFDSIMSIRRKAKKAMS